MRKFKLFLYLSAGVFQWSLLLSAEDSLTLVEDMMKSKGLYEEATRQDHFVQIHAADFFYSEKINAGQFRSYVSLHFPFIISDPEKIEKFLVFERESIPLLQFISKIAVGLEKSTIKEIVVRAISENGQIDNGSGDFDGGTSTECHRRYIITLTDSTGKELKKTVDATEHRYDVPKNDAGCIKLMNFLTNKTYGLALSLTGK